MIALSQVEFAQQARALYHQNSKSLRNQVGLTREIVCQMVKQCDICPQYLSVPHQGANSQGLPPNHLWQMDVTHIVEYDKSRYVYVTINTHSGFLMATAQPGEATKHVITYC